MLVTDAMPSVGSGLSSFEIDGNTITRSDGKLTRADRGAIVGDNAARLLKIRRPKAKAKTTSKKQRR